MSSRLWLGLVAAAGLVGLAVSVYLTEVHWASAALLCSNGGAVNCERVLSSAYGVIAGTGVPTAAAGIGWFAVSIGLALPRWRRPGSALLSRLHLLWSGAGLAVVVGLVFVEIVLLGAICAWCTVAHAMVLVTFLALVTAEAEPVPR
jgi:uncharacterized membrane protein